MTSSFSPGRNSLTVTELQKLDFSQLTLQEKIQIKTKGRPLPEIQICQPGISNNKKYIRSFNAEWYQRKIWLCGCEVKNALFCFPCLLFGGDATWTNDGFKNISRVKIKIEKHEKSKKHIENMVSLSLLGTVNIKEKLSEAYRLSVSEHNRKVTKNREILSKIIDCILISGYDEETLLNPGICKGLLNFASMLDPDLKNQLETSVVFKYVLETIQKEILDCLMQIYHEEIKKEIREASFVAVMVADTSDVSEETQMAIILRYMVNEEIFEHFWGFFVPENPTEVGITQCILEQLEIILQGNGYKLIAQSIDGTNVVKGKKGEVQTEIKSVYTNAHFMHCYAHQLDQIIRNAASVSRDSRIFFANLMAIPTFFSKSPQRRAILKKHMAITNPRYFNIRTINRVHENLQPLKSCLSEIQSTSNTDHTIAEATGILQYLEHDTFLFWLELFHQIVPHVEVIYIQMQFREIDASKVSEYVTTFEAAILEIRNSNYCENPSVTLMAEAKLVCECICDDVVDRYSFTKHLAAAKLFNKANWINYKKSLPTEEIRLITEAYPMIDKEKFVNELRVYFSRSDLQGYYTLIDLLKFIQESNLSIVLSEITKVIKILLTIPMITSEPERCLLTMNKIKTFLRNCTIHERLNALAMLSTEKNFLASHPDIKEKVINLFAQNEIRKMDFVFK